MNYIENVFVCLAAPLPVAVLCMRGRGRRMVLFLLGGMTVCLLSSYISTFLAAVQGADLTSASLEIAPLVEELMKLIPVLFYIVVFEAGREEAFDSILMTAIGFATFENACYLTQNGAERLSHLLIRGFGTGAMHVVCGGIIAIGLFRIWNRAWLRAVGTVALAALAISYHGIYNILVFQSGAVAVTGCLIPLFTALLGLIFSKKLYPDLP